MISKRMISNSAICGVITALGWIGIQSANQADIQSDTVHSAVHQVPAEAMAKIDEWVGRRIAADLSPRHRDMLAALIDARREDQSHQYRAAACFAPGTPNNVIEAFDAALNMSGAQVGFNLIGRWSNTTTNGGGLSQGQPTTLTYSFAPDGTFVPNMIGVSGNSNLFAFLNGIYGGPAPWQSLFAQCFARWQQLCGITYVFEPNDDGVNLNGLSGSLGVRGDLRIAGIAIDGTSNTLAYNNFPNDGDMVIDTSDGFYSNTSNNSRRLRNVVMHEHGHGMGLLHVCPINQSKLMEPFASTSFDGPRHDDLRGSQRHYGDPFEPDNSIAAANPLGTLAIPSSVNLGTPPTPTIPNGSTLSIDANGEQDFFSFAITSGAAVTVTVSPVGLNYDDANQACGANPGDCCTDDFTDSAMIANLSVQVIGSDGTTVLETASGQPIGVAETLTDVILPGAGTYYVRVFESSAPSESQLYNLSLSLIPLPFSISLPDGAPAVLEPGEDASFDVLINPAGDSIVPGSPTLNYRFAPGPFQTEPLVPQGGMLYIATIPGASCAAAPEFFVSAEGDDSGIVTEPPGGAAAPLTAIVGEIDVAFSDNFQVNMGWTVTDIPNGGGTFDGTWDRGVPLGDGMRGDPVADFDGSGNCFLTDRGAGNTDVDNGETILTSPIINVSTMADPFISYARWYSNTEGAAEQADILTVEVSSNGGGAWTTLEVVGPTLASPNPEVDGGWFEKSFRIADFVAITSQFRVRFRASDLGDGSIVEAGVDAVRIEGLSCFFDCNSNGISDETEPDCDGDTVPDACELDGNDCNTNALPDDCEGGDCNTNGVLDFCDTRGENDCNSNGLPDSCDVLPTALTLTQVQSLGGSDATAVAQGDIDNDGDIDLVATRGDTNQARLYLNNGAGVLAQGASLTVGSAPSDVVLAHFNADAFLDMAVANRNADTVSILLNNGNDGGGVWQGFAAQFTVTGTEPTSLVAADFTGNGAIDIAMTRYDFSRVRLVENNGSAVFTGAGGFITHAQPIALATEDFDKDGTPDLVVSTVGSDGIQVMLNLGRSGGTWLGFAPPVDYLSTTPRGVTSADFNGDTFPDIAVCRQAADRVRLHLNNGDGTFTGSLQLIVPGGPVDVIHTDFDNDGNVDLVAVSETGNTVSVLRNRGNGPDWLGFSPAVPFAAETTPVALTDFNLNGDALPDIAIANNGSGTVSFMRNDALPPFSGDCNTNATPDECDALVDLDTDGIPDICQVAAVDCNSNGIPDGTEPDCNTNNTPDDCEMLVDCDTNGTPDVCEASPDCNTNGTLDLCESFTDCNANSIPDACDVLAADCNNNGVPDDCDADCNTNATPDDCEALADCNTNAMPDECEAFVDCNTNDHPDECDVAAADCNGNGMPDECDALLSDCNTNGLPDDCDADCDSNGTPDDCEVLDDCNTDGVPDICGGFVDCDSNGVLDACDPDCNTNGSPDACDALDDCDTDGTPDLCGAFIDCNTNAVLDVCELLDCNTNDVIDPCDIALIMSMDCNANGLPDECETAALDCNDNDIPDDCEADCNTNGVPDDCDGLADCNTNGTPDECDTGDCDANGVLDECEMVDCNTNGVLDACDIASMASTDGNVNHIPDECEAVACPTCVGDVNTDGLINGDDIGCFVECLITGSTAGCADCTCADLNSGGAVDTADLTLFVTALLTGPGPCP